MSKTLSALRVARDLKAVVFHVIVEVPLKLFLGEDF